MALILDETFATGIPAGFATIVNDYGVLTATYNAGQQAVDFTKDGYNAGWRLDACPASMDVRVVLDLEIITADNAGSVGSGIGVYFKSASELFARGILAGWESQSVGLLHGSSSSPLSASVTDYSLAALIPNTGRHIFEFITVRNPGTGVRQVQVWMGGRLLMLYADTQTPYASAISSYLYVRDCAVRLHSIQVHDDPALFVPTPRLPSLKNLTAAIRQTIGGDGAIRGRVSIYGEVTNTPAARKVRLYRELDNLCIAETWSSAETGEYAFEGLDRSLKYTVIGYDRTATFIAEIRDGITPVRIEPWHPIFPDVQNPYNAYWRLNVAASSAGIQTYIMKWRLFNANGVNLVNRYVDGLHAPDHSGSNGTTTIRSYMPVDSSPNAIFLNGPTVWLILPVPYGDKQYQRPVTMEIMSSSNVAYTPKDFTLEYSLDGSTWTTVLTITNQTGWTSGQVRSWAVPPA